MSLKTALVALALLAACDSPSVAFMGTEKTVVLIGGDRFSVHRRDDRVEVYRTNITALPRRSAVLLRAQLAINQATGCKVRKGTLEGDQALVRAGLSCQGQVSPPPPVPRNLVYDCEVIETWEIQNRKVVVEAIECELVPA